MAFLGVLCSVLYQKFKRQKRQTDANQDSSERSSDSNYGVSLYDTPEGAEILTEVQSFKIGLARSTDVDSGMALAQALDAGSIRIRNRATGNEKRDGILRPASIGTRESNSQSMIRSPSHAPRKVRFDIPTSLSYSPDSSDFLASVSSIMGEEKYSSAFSDRIDPETWATWIMDGVVTDYTPADPKSEASGGTCSPTPLPTVPLLPHDHAPLDWERFGSMGSRPLGSCHMFPLRRFKSDEVRKDIEQSNSAFAGAFGCGWMRDEDLNSVATTPFGASRETSSSAAEQAKDVEPGHAEI
jgi:hypothetical protein